MEVDTSKSVVGKSGTSRRKNEETDPERNVELKYEPLYCYTEPKLQEIEGKLNYSPKHFLRTHSKNNDPADVQTQIWQCCFEPDLNRAHGYRNIVATCGGNSVCFINVENGKVPLKYHRPIKGLQKDSMYALAWTAVPIDETGLKRTNVIAAGGGKATVLLIHPEAGVCYCLFKSSLSKSPGAVCSLLFHPKNATWLFCGHENGSIQLWDIGRLTHLPSYDVEPVLLLSLPSVGGAAYNMVYSEQNDLLITGCDLGLYARQIDLEKINKSHRLNRTVFKLPDPNGKGQIVDSICLIGDDILAAKCVLHGYIYLFKLSNVLEHAVNGKDNEDEATVEENDVLRLKWSDTDNYYMNMGVDKKSCILVCGDDIGMLWVYDLYKYITGEIPNPLSGDSPVDPVTCSVQLKWPKVNDPEIVKAGKLKLDTYDIVIDKCAVSEEANYIVAVTSNNMVCIWELDESSR